MVDGGGLPAPAGPLRRLGCFCFSSGGPPLSRPAAPGTCRQVDAPPSGAAAQPPIRATPCQETQLGFLYRNFNGIFRANTLEIMAFRSSPLATSTVERTSASMLYPALISAPMAEPTAEASRLGTSDSSSCMPLRARQPGGAGGLAPSYAQRRQQGTRACTRGPACHAGNRVAVASHPRRLAHP